MTVLNRIAYFQNRRDQVPNQELAKDLTATKDRKGIREIAENLWNENPNVQMGLLFSKSVHDELAFRAVQAIAMEMLALATGEPWEQIEPLRASVFSCPTPFAAGDAAVIDEAGQILLVQRADNGKRAMPGGLTALTHESPLHKCHMQNTQHALLRPAKGLPFSVFTSHARQ